MYPLRFWRSRGIERPKSNMQRTTSASPRSRTTSSRFGQKSSSGPSTGSRTRSFSSSPARGGFRSSSRSSGSRGGGRGFRGEFINESQYINKAPVQKEEEKYVPKHTFGDFDIHEILAKNLLAKGFIHPSPIQDQAIPVALTGRDIIGIASTGTGKTAAFLIPIINKLVADKTYRAIVLAPTRELAQQIEVEFKAFTFGMRLFSVSCVGGSPIGKQMRELERGVHVVIGTPGRVKDLIERRKMYMQDYHAVVLDEADRMLDMGFVDDMRYILGRMPKTRQGFFFSATFSPEIRTLCHEFLTDPVSISLKTRDTSSSVDQDVVRVGEGQNKIDLLHDLLIKPEFKKVLIFREMKREVDSLQKELASRGFKALSLHGDMRNRERERAVKALAEGAAHVVIATDVAARGIDIPDISHVINYDLPSTFDTYIHRIGRTGRGTKKGTALTFVNGSVPRRDKPAFARSSRPTGRPASRSTFRFKGR